MNEASVIYIRWAGSPLHHCKHKGTGRLHPHANVTSAKAETSPHGTCGAFQKRESAILISKVFAHACSETAHVAKWFPTAD